MKFALLFLASMSIGACATAPRPPVAVESVGTLAPSYHSIAVAPVHAGTDLSPGGFVAADDDETPVTVGTGEVIEAPEVAVKGGLVMGGVR